MEAGEETSAAAESKAVPVDASAAPAAEPSEEPASNGRALAAVEPKKNGIEPEQSNYGNVAEAEGQQKVSTHKWPQG